jgi:hypothetical protein
VKNRLHWSLQSPVAYLAACLIVYFGLWIGIPKARFLATLAQIIDSATKTASLPVSILLSICGIIVVSVPTILFMAAQVSVVYQFSRLRLGFRGAALVWLGLFALLVMIVSGIIWRLDVVNKLHRWPTLREIGFIVGMYRHGLLKMFMFATILLLASCTGYLVSLRIRDRNLLLPVVMFAAFIDLWTVSVGPVSTVMKRAPEVVSAVSAPIPQAGTGAFVPALMMGLGDPLFMAVVFASVHKLGLNARRNYSFVLAIMTLAMLAVLLDFAPYIPALIALAVAVVLANWGQFKLSRQEKISTAIVALALIATLPLVWYVLRPAPPTEKSTHQQHNRDSSSNP